jgi:hypothetical protein
MGFKNRSEKGEAYFERLIQFFSSLGYIVVKTGSEYNYLNQHTQLLELPEDLTSKYFRYYPDGFYISIKEKKSVFFEAKHGDNIEKDAYIIYLKMQTMGLSVLICILNNKNEEYHIPIEKLTLVHGLKTINEFNFKLPVDSSGWISPRLLDKPKYEYWKEHMSWGNASGTPYRRIAFDSLQQYKKEYTLPVVPITEPSKIEYTDLDQIEPPKIDNNDYHGLHSKR